jgi:hypothetical protein
LLRFQAILLELRKHHLPASGAASSTEDSTAVLQLLGVAANLVAKLAACEGLLRAALSELGSLVGSVGDNTQALDPVTLRLLASEVRLHHFLTPLPSTACAISALLSHCIVICVLSWGCKFRCTFLGAHPSTQQPNGLKQVKFSLFSPYSLFHLRAVRAEKRMKQLDSKTAALNESCCTGRQLVCRCTFPPLPGTACNNNKPVHILAWLSCSEAE